jgi:hypothetical protein
MNQNLDIMAAQSMAHERERATRMTVRHSDQALRAQEAAARRAPAVPDDGHHWLHDLLVRTHLAHAPIH